MNKIESMEIQEVNHRANTFLSEKLKFSILLIVSFVFLIAYSQIRGGRGSLGEQIFIGASSIASEQPLYAGTNEGIPMLNSSPYFPGVAFLSYPIFKLTNNGYITENIMLVISVLSTYLLILVLYILYTILNKETSLSKLYFFIVAFSFLLISESFLGYTVEFKPDTLSLALAIIFFMREMKEVPNYSSHFINGIFLFAALSLKQQTSVFILGIFIGSAILNFRTGLKKYLYSCVVMAVTVTLFIFSIFQSKSLLLHTFLANTGRSFRMSLLEYINEILAINQVYFLVVFFILLFAFDRIKKSLFIKKNNETLFVYIFGVALYSIIQFLSGLNAGGNQGNIQVVLVLTIPLLVYLFEIEFKNSLKIFLSKSYYLLIVCILILTIKYAIKLPSTFLREKDAISKLSKYEKIIIPGDLITKTPLQNIVSDYYAFIHLKAGILKLDTSIQGQYQKAYESANYFAFNPRQLAENPEMLDQITLKNFKKFQIVDSAYARAFGKFYIYKIR